MAKQDGYGAVLLYDSTGVGDYVAIGQVRDIDGPELVAEAIEATAHDDASNNHRTYIEGLLDLGDLSFELIFDQGLASHAWLVSTGRNAINGLRLIFADTSNTTWTFEGLMTSLSPKNPVDGLMAADVTFKCSGQLTVS